MKKTLVSFTKLIKFSLLMMLFCVLFSCSTSSSSSKDEEENASNSGTESPITSPSQDSSSMEWSGDKNYVSAKNVDSSTAENQSENLESDWYKKTSFYHIWVKSFYDSDGDGYGDLKGITQKLDYIKDTVGCDGIWLSPIFECSGKGSSVHGYDTTDYYAVNNQFGTESDLIELINACHAKNMKIIFDFVPNHTSNNHQWFKDSASNSNGKRNWYMWSDKQLNWKPMDGSVWKEKTVHIITVLLAKVCRI